MENNENAAKTEKRSKLQGDVRTFCIALLTTVIVLALYHFGTGVYAIFCGTANYGSMPVTREYVLVPVMALPQQGPGMHDGPGRHGGFRGQREGGFRGQRKGDFRHGKRGEMPPAPAMRDQAPDRALEGRSLPPPPPAQEK